MFLPEELKIALGSAALVILGLGYAARRYPHVGWLQSFDLHKHLTTEQRERMRRRGNVLAGAQFILLGIVIPLGYFALKVMFFSSITGIELTTVGATSLTCIALGIVAIARNR